MKNLLPTPKDFPKQAVVKCHYTGIRYVILEPDKKGMAVLHNLNTGKNEPWNAYNNNRFLPVEPQGKLFQ